MRNVKCYNEQFCIDGFIKFNAGGFSYLGWAERLAKRWKKLCKDRQSDEATDKRICIREFTALNECFSVIRFVKSL